MRLSPGRFALTCASHALSLIHVLLPCPSCKAWCPGHSRNSHVPRFIVLCDSTQLVRTMDFNINLLPLVAACATCLFLFLSASYLSSGYSCIEWEKEEEDRKDIKLWEDNWDDIQLEDDFSKQLRSVTAIALPFHHNRNRSSWL